MNSGTLNEGGRERSPTYTKLLLHCDGTDGSTTFTDTSLSAHTVTAYGDAQIDTAQSKFGGASGLFDGTGDYLTTPDSDDWNFGTGAFTIDFWIRFNDRTGEQDFFGQVQDANNWWWAYISAAGVLGIAFQSGGARLAEYYSAAQTLNVNTRYHIAFVRTDNGHIKCYIDGGDINWTTLTTAVGKTLPDYSSVLYVGTRAGGGPFINGWLDEFRISKGIARWTANFTPPTQPYSISVDDSNFSSRFWFWQDTIGEPCIGQAISTSRILEAGYIPAIQSNPPNQKQIIPNFTWKENESKPEAFDLDDYFSSPDGYSLTYTVSGNSSINVSIDPNTHKVSFSQPQAWFGLEKIKFTATDSENNSTQSNEVTLLVEGVDNPPLLDFIPDISVNETELVIITPHATDLDNDPITYTFTAPLNSEGKWQTNYNSAGTYTVTVTAKDTTNLSDTQEVKITVRNVNRPPVLEPIPDITANEGDLVTVTPKATDPDGDAITLYYSSPLDNTGKWLTDYDDARPQPYVPTVTASDGIDTVSRTVKITIKNTNRPPQATLTMDKYTVTPNETIKITIYASDPDGDAMTFSLKKDNQVVASGNITNTYNTSISISAIGDHNISATVIDSGGLSTINTKGVDVVDPNADRNAINPVMGDFNGDCLSDLGLHNSDTGTWEICLSDGGDFRNARDWLTGFGTSRDWWPMGGDFNGDGLTDIGIYNNSNGELKVATSTGSSFSVSGTWLTFPGASYSWQPTTGNFNGDKYTDFTLYNKDTGEVRVALGTGSGFGAFTTWLSNFGTDYVVLAGDFNCDSLTDICLFKKSTGEFKVAFSNTKAFVDGANWISGFAVDKDPLIFDFTNDGLSDIGYWDKSSFNWYYAISTGEKFVDKGLWLNFGTSADESGSSGDFDGNGVTDLATFDRDQIGINRWIAKLSTNKPADLLTEIDNDIGGKTKITYTYAAKSENDLLPFPVYVASNIILINAFPQDRAATYTQEFIFSGGYYDAAEREFRGFAKVRVTDPVTNNYTETYFYQGKSGQDGALKGQIEKVFAFDGNSRKVGETINTYEVKKAGPEEKILGFPALNETTTTVWEENATYITTQDKFAYDNIGNLIEGRSEGIVQTNVTGITTTGDEKSTSNTYAQAYELGYNRTIETILKDKNGNVASKKNFEYDIKGNLAKETLFIFNPITQETKNTTTQYAYDLFGNLISATNDNFATVTTVYETTFYTYPETSTNDLGHAIQYVYEPRFGSVKAVTDPNGNTITMTYDSLGRVTQVKNALEHITTTYTYPDFNSKITTNAAGISTTDYIDGLGRKYKTVSSGEDGSSPRQVASEVFYNSRGLKEKESLPHYVDENPLQISYVRYEYDIRGRVKKTISDFPGLSVDAESTLNYINPLYIEIIDPRGHKKGTRKDVWGNIVERIEFTQGGVYHTYYEYDTQNNLLKVTDNQNNITPMFYDSLGQKVKMIDPDMGTWTYEYDGAGNLIKQIDSKEQVLEFTYDKLNRLTSKVANGQTLVTYIYDETNKENCIGMISKIFDQSGSTEFFYDKLGREIKSIKTVDNNQYIVVREYDVLDRLTKLTYPDGEVVNYAYDANSGFLERVHTLNSQLSTLNYIQDITYNAQGQIKTVQYGNNVITRYTYGQDLRLIRILTQNSTHPPQDLNYLFDKNGNITTLTDNLRSNIRTFTYDDLDRLTDAYNIPSPQGGYTNFHYQYDPIGNMTYKSDLGFFTYGEGNAGPHAVTRAGSNTYTYDANGNMIVGKNKTMSYDAENRLIEVNELGIITTFVYDGGGGRVKKTVGQDSTIYIGSLFEKTTDYTDSGQITQIKKHIFAGANRVATVESTGNTYYYHSDHLGSSNIITNQSGNQVQYCEYTPYGTLARNEGQNLVKHKFTGKELDNTGLYFYGARYYDPVIGRFIQADSIVPSPYNPQTFNRYSYCNNNPLNYIDPSGHIWWWVIPLIIGMLVGAVAAGIQSDWDVKTMLVGAGVGAISGVVGFGVGSTLVGVGLNVIAASAIGGAAGGIVAGTLNAAIYGGDMLKGALLGAGLGALGGAVFGALSQIDVKGLISGFTKFSLFAVAGGGLSELGGGEFWQGAALAGAIAMSEILYRGVLSTDKEGRKNTTPSMDTANPDAKAEPKLTREGKKHTTMWNDTEKLKLNCGIANKEGSPPPGRFSLHEGAPIPAFFEKLLAGIAGVSKFHDAITTWYSNTPIGFTNGLFFNVETMVPSYIITSFGAASVHYPMIVGQFTLYGNDSSEE